MGKKKTKLYIVEEIVETVEVGTPEEEGYKYEYLTKILDIKRKPAPVPKVLKSIPLKDIKNGKEIDGISQKDLSEALTRKIRPEDMKALEETDKKKELEKIKTSKTPKVAEKKVDKKADIESKKAKKDIVIAKKDIKVPAKPKTSKVKDIEPPKEVKKKENDKIEVSKVADVETLEDELAEPEIVELDNIDNDAQVEEISEIEVASDAVDEDLDELDEISKQLEEIEDIDKIKDEKVEESEEEKKDDLEMLEKKFDEIEELENDTGGLRKDTMLLQDVGELGDPDNFDAELEVSQKRKAKMESEIKELDDDIKDLDSLNDDTEEDDIVDEIEVVDDEIVEEIEVVDDEIVEEFEVVDDDVEVIEDDIEAVEDDGDDTDVPGLEFSGDDEIAEVEKEAEEGEKVEDKKEKKLLTAKRPTARLVGSKGRKKTTKQISRKNATGEEAEKAEEGEDMDGEEQEEKKKKKSISKLKYNLLLWGSLGFTVIVVVIVCLDWIFDINIRDLWREPPTPEKLPPPDTGIHKDTRIARTLMSEINKYYDQCKSGYNGIMTQFHKNDTAEEKDKVPMSALRKRMKAVLMSIFYVKGKWFELLVVNMRIYKNNGKNPLEGDLSRSEEGAFPKKINKLEKIIKNIVTDPNFIDLMNDEEVIKEKEKMLEKKSIYENKVEEYALLWDPDEYIDTLEKKFDDMNSKRLVKYDEFCKLKRKFETLKPEDKKVKKDLTEIAENVYKLILETLLSYYKMVMFSEEKKRKIDFLPLVEKKVKYIEENTIDEFKKKLKEASIDFKEIKDKCKDLQKELDELKKKLAKKETPKKDTEKDKEKEKDTEKDK